MVDRNVLMTFLKRQPVNVIINLAAANARKKCDCEICVETRAALKMLEKPDVRHQPHH